MGTKIWPRSWFRSNNERNIIFIILIIICAVLCFALIAVIITWGVLSDFQFGKGKISACQNEECVQAAAQIVHSLDKSVNPCNDFYQFACGNYLSETVLPEDKIRMNPLSDMDFKLSNRLKIVLETPSTTDEPKYERMTKMLYRSCNNVEMLSTLGWAPLKQLMLELGGWPVVQGANWTSKHETWEETNAAIAAATGVDTIFGLNIDVDMKDTSRRMLALEEVRVVLENTEYYLSPKYKNVLDAYRDAMISIAMRLGASKRNAIKEMTEVLKLEIMLANISLKLEDRRDYNHFFNPLTLGEIKKRFSQINFERWINTLISSAWNLSDNEMINVLHEPFFQQLPLLLNQTSMRTIVNYEMWWVATTFIPFLEPDLRHPLKTLQKLLIGTTAEPARWEECVSVTMTLLGWPLSSLYVKRYFPPAAKTEMETLVANVRLAMKENIMAVPWMDDSTRSHALAKLSNMRQKIGYPDYIHNFSKITKDSHGLQLNESDFFSNVLLLTRKRIERELSRLRKRVDRNDWGIPPAMVNAFYSPENNEIMFPAGILQFPVFPMTVPRYVHYSRIGMVIGHEITHSYDDQGRQFNQDGNLALWWTNKTLREFSERAKCFINQYNAITEPITGQKLNGKLTLGENIADNGAIKLAHKAYRLSQIGASEPLLPGFSNYTHDQLFFLAYATSWCEVMRPEAINMIMLSDTHSLTRYRVNVPLQNYPEFAKAFQCPAGTFMNPKRRCTLW